MTLAQTIARAQQSADASGEPCVVLNLNTVGAALYVIRDYLGEEPLARVVARNGKRFCAAVVKPHEAPDMRGGYTL